jgi:hypothetical protein
MADANFDLKMKCEGHGPAKEMIIALQQDVGEM